MICMFYQFSNCSNLSIKEIPQILRVGISKCVLFLMLSIFLNAGASASPLIHAVSGGDLDEIERLVAEGADVNAGNKSGTTPLHFASGQGKTTIVQLLLSHGADVNAKNEDGWTPLHFAAGFAAGKGQATMVELLINKGAEINARDVIGLTALSIAANLGNVPLVGLLLNKGVDINAGNKSGMTPLHFAAVKGNAAIVQLLLSQDADVNVRNRLGDTPQEVAVGLGHSNVVELIRKHVAVDKSQIEGKPWNAKMFSTSKNADKLQIKDGSQNTTSNYVFTNVQGRKFIEYFKNIEKFRKSEYETFDEYRTRLRNQLNKKIRLVLESAKDVQCHNGEDVFSFNPLSSTYDAENRVMRVEVSNQIECRRGNNIQHGYLQYVNTSEKPIEFVLSSIEPKDAKALRANMRVEINFGIHIPQSSDDRQSFVEVNRRKTLGGGYHEFTTVYGALVSTNLIESRTGKTVSTQRYLEQDANECIQRNDLTKCQSTSFNGGCLIEHHLIEITNVCSTPIYVIWFWHDSLREGEFDLAPGRSSTLDIPLDHKDYFFRAFK